MPTCIGTLQMDTLTAATTIADCHITYSPWLVVFEMCDVLRHVWQQRPVVFILIVGWWLVARQLPCDATGPVLH